LAVCGMWFDSPERVQEPLCCIRKNIVR